ncbi:MAG: ribonuclease HI [Gammaproteobacteria bacterium]|nr:MAG: ribonuclease HI [Gammaproteobacteria bacterium]
MAKKFYVVWRGRETGIFTDWNTCQNQVDRFPTAKFKSFSTREEAEAAFRGKQPTATSRPKTDSAPERLPAKNKSNAQTVKTFTAAEIAAMRIETKIFTDGGCEPNPGEAGSGVAVYRNDVVAELWYGLFNPQGTNNTAELNALNQALIMAKEEIGKDKSVAIFCDSKYSIQCVTQWAVNWEKNGWRKKNGEIKNLDLIKEMFALYQSLKYKIQVLHVNGHVGVEGNELADRMSILAIETQEVDFTLYGEEIDITSILAFRSG